MESIRLEIHACDHCNLACMGCNHASPFLRKRHYTANDYIPWIERLLDSGAQIDILAITGGEPFLNKGINEFAAAIKARFPNIWLEIFSNMFWLKDASTFDEYAGVLSSVNHLNYSLYKPIVEKAGGEHVLHDLVKQAQVRFPNLTVRCTVGTINEMFALALHTEYPRPRHVTDEFCFIKDCTQLKADGTLLRCPLGHSIGSQPGLPKGFAESKDMKYDLKTDLGVRPYEEWRKKWAFDACDYCGCGRRRDTWVNWVSDHTIRGMTAEEYNDRLNILIDEGT